MGRLRALRYFVKLANALSFSETAGHFRVPSSSVSRRIKDLEGELGAALFERTTRSVRLTELGKLYLGEVPSLWSEIRRWLEPTARIYAALRHRQKRSNYRIVLRPEILRPTPWPQKKPHSIVCIGGHSDTYVRDRIITFRHAIRLYRLTFFDKFRELSYISRPILWQEMSTLEQNRFVKKQLIDA